MACMASFFAFLGLVEGVLLRVKGNDVTVWKYVQGAAAWIDILMVFGAYRQLEGEGRLSPSLWRGDEYQHVVGNAVFGLVRIACALGIGMPESEDKTKLR